CAGKFDITLVLDSSNAVGLDGFNKVKTFAGQLVDAFNIGDTKFAVITSGKSTKIDFMFNTLKGGALKISNLQSAGLGVDVASAIKLAADNAFTVFGGVRQTVPKTFVLFVPGKAS
ncbi:predicted protein, partial [Nematostella vectensis]